MHDRYNEFEMQMDAVAAAMREEYANRSRVRQQAMAFENASSLARLLHRADAWLQKVTEMVLASFA